MNLWKRIRHLSLKQLWRLSVLFLKHPLLVVPTLRATKKTFDVCDKLYAKTHHKSTSANAFRHALWNVLICKAALRVTKSKQKSVFWAQKVTDLYEKVTQNKALDEAMDLHNNAVGRLVFLNHLTRTEEELIGILKVAVKSARKMSRTEETDKNKTMMLYID